VTPGRPVVGNSCTLKPFTDAVMRQGALSQRLGPGATAEDRRARGTCHLPAGSTRCVSGREELLSEAVQLLSEESGSRLELSKALHDLSQAHQDLGQGSRSRMLAEQAARRRASSLAPVSLPDDNPASAGAVAALSEAERRVAVLAANGHTNRAVADALFITVSTVEQHLTRIYRKLNVTRRRELATKFRQELIASEVPGPRTS